jgi:ketosteroid isomerase-like protein
LERSTSYPDCALRSPWRGASLGEPKANIAWSRHVRFPVLSPAPTSKSRNGPRHSRFAGSTLSTGGGADYDPAIPAREAKFRPMPAWVTSASGQQQRASRDPKTVVEQVIRKLDNERIQAQIHADAAALERIYADDFIGVGPSGTVRTKPQVISDFTSGDLKFRSITTDDVRVHVYGDAAVETGRSTMDGQDKGKAVPHDTRFTRVWVKQQGCWRLVANHYSSNTSHQ